MKKGVLLLMLTGFAVFSLNTVYADTAIRLNIKTAARTIYDRDITVTPCDSDNAGTLAITPYCAILQSRIPSVWDWSWAPGAFVTSIDGVTGFTSQDSDGNNVYHYWSWSSNGMEGMVGLNQYDLQPNDLIILDFIDPVPPAPVVRASFIPDPVFDTAKAFEFLISKQEENGSFGENLYTDWVALALASGNYREQTLKLIEYFGKLKMKNLLLTDYERHAMALMALGLNPYDTNGENYVEKIIAQFDGWQFGEKNMDNDDIFALIVLQNAGFTENDKIIKDDIDFILSRQHKDGSWDGNVDMTGAAIESLSAFSPTRGVGESLKKAKDFLGQNQKSNGSWDDNVSSTAWAWQGLSALGEKPENWKKGGNTPLNYLGTMQLSDGGTKNENLKNKIWENAYAVTALSGKTWNQIMQKFEKPKEDPIPPKIEKKISKQIIVKKTATTKILSQNTATVINSLNTEPTKKNWFVKLLEKIFGIF